MKGSSATLVIGPPGSGKTRRTLEELESALSVGEPATLVTPTASMAEHLLHQAARRRLAVPGDAILPLRAFVEKFTPDWKELPASIATLLVERALERAAAPEFRELAAYAGFHSRLLEAMEEFWSAGADGRLFDPLLEGSPARPFGRVMVEYERLLEAARAVHRARRLRRAAEEMQERRLGHVLFDGFLNFTPVELELVRAVAAAAQRCVVTLPASGAEQARQALLDFGLEESRLERIYRPLVRPVVVVAASPEREIEDVARRILRDQEQTGRPFQEYGLILRNPDVYGPLVAVVFERFGIPFRSRQPQSLDQHMSARYLAGLLRLAATGFDGVAAIEVMKAAGSGIGLDGEMDQYEFRLREELPGQGLEFLRRQAAGLPRVKQWLARLDELAGWVSKAALPENWAERAKNLSRSWFREPAVEDGVSHETALELRALARALQVWEQAAEETAEALRLGGAEKVSLADYLGTLYRVLRLTRFAAPDRRRNVVQVLSIYEARQWELPVVFVCGLVEKQFPRHHPQNLFFPDRARQRLSRHGLRLRTSADLDREERFLFDLAMTRATEQLYLTYPVRDETGTETLRSFFLREWARETARRALVREPAPAWRPAGPKLEDPRLHEELERRHERFSPSTLEEYLQCPFLFFAARTLRLEQPPCAPDERLDELLKGTIVHRTIARWAGQGGGEIGPVFEAVFDEVCEQERIRLNFRAEAIRMQLKADLERFAEYERARLPYPGFHPGEPEKKIEYMVEGNRGESPFRVTGRIDRYEASEAGATVVVDYKYSRDERIKELVGQQEEGLKVQAGLYLLGLERQLGLVPAGMVYYGLRGKPFRSGWWAAGLGPADPDLQEMSVREFRAMLDQAAERTLAAVREIRGGRVAVEPRDRQFCREFCAYRDVCRVSL
ncbi:MAG: exodeoxyribonuclease V subunit gamma [Acidobacteria bacterium]|nr:exodeoxyribonuclease V subunit gamma [Acidobacteriota bacterium]